MYTLGTSTSAVNRDPASLAVAASPGPPAALAPGPGVAVILDSSSSMRKKFASERRIDFAKASLRSLIEEGLAEGVPVSLQIFGGKGKGKSKAARCESRLLMPLAPLDRDETLKMVRKLKAGKKTGHPCRRCHRCCRVGLGHCGRRARAGRAHHRWQRDLRGDLGAAIAELRADGIDVNLDIVGLALGDEELKAQMASWAEAGGGRYFDAASAAELGNALATAVAAPFRVYPLDADSRSRVALWAASRCRSSPAPIVSRC